MTLQKEWETIISKLKGKRTEFPTVPKVKKVPVWFTATTDGNVIFIDKALNHQPSSQITSTRKLTYTDFEKVYPLFLKREKGKSVSREVTAVTVNQVYYFSLIHHLIHTKKE